MAKETRLRQWGLELFGLPPGPLNSITDVQGVAVSHRRAAPLGQHLYRESAGGIQEKKDDLLYVSKL